MTQVRVNSKQIYFFKSLKLKRLEERVDHQHSGDGLQAESVYVFYLCRVLLFKSNLVVSDCNYWL